MGTNKHARDRVETGHTTPPPGHDRITDDSHALRAGKDGRDDVRREIVQTHNPAKPLGR